MKLSSFCKDLEERAGQEAMIADIERAYLENHKLLVEAGTGIGKSIAYLLPAMRWCEKTGENTVISTHTIALQEQLTQKEIPFLLDILGLDLHVVLLKGMGNYRCLLKEEEGQEDVKADPLSCTHSRCPHFMQCPYFKRKREAEKADLIIVNHHLLLADLTSDFQVLPEYDRLIIDEAHHLEEIATHYFSEHVSLSQLLKLSREERFSSAARALFQEIGPPRRFEQIPWQAAAAELLEIGKELLQTMEEETAKLKLLRHLDALEKISNFVPNDEAVCFSTPGVIHLAELDISSSLREKLFNEVSTVVLCSATLTAGGEFTYLKKRLGIEGAEERIYESPFDYPSQALLVALTDMPEPNSPGFEAAATRLMMDAILQSKGGAFVLFTSHAMLQSCMHSLKDSLEKEGYPLFCQGDEERTTLLNKFKESENGVLFGTDSFWEGVDVVGDGLRLVILVRLPFKAPGDPLYEARLNKIAKEGGSPFFDYSLPQAIMKFKQGFGRLIRDKADRGSVVCLDSRLVKKGYGKLFQKSLPPCTKEAIPLSHLAHLLATFYGSNDSNS